MGSTYYFVENLTLLAWAFSIWPRLIGQRIRNGSPVICCYVIDGSPLTLLLAKISSFITGVPVRKLDFRLADMQSEDGESVRWRILYGDLAQVQSTAAADSSYQKFLEATSRFGHFPDFLAKKLERTTMYLIQKKPMQCIFHYLLHYKINGSQKLLNTGNMLFVKNLPLTHFNLQKK